jgi:hypothetical protein
VPGLTQGEARLFAKDFAPAMNNGRENICQDQQSHVRVIFNRRTRPFYTKPSRVRRKILPRDFRFMAIACAAVKE